MTSAAQILQHPLKARAAVVIVSGVGIAVDGVAPSIEVVALPRHTAVHARDQLVGGIRRFIREIALYIRCDKRTALIQRTAQLLFRPLTAGDHENNTAEEGKDQNGNDPGELDLGISRSVHNIDHRQKAEHIEDKGNGQVVRRKVEKNKEQPGKLQSNREADKHDT